MSIYREIKSRIYSFIVKNNLINSQDKIVIAVSGGADSMFMLRILSDLKDELSIDIAIAHINHGIREKSDKDENFVVQSAKKMGIPVYVKKLNYSQKLDNKNTEAWAREHRYTELEKIRKELNFDKIATAHNSNDQIETILQRISEKSGIGGLRGIRRESGRVIRPILTISRKEIDKIVQELEIDHIEDETNQDITLKRNYFRHKVIPQWEKLYPNLGDAFQFVCDSADDNKRILNYFFSELESEIVTKTQDSASKKISSDKIEKLPINVKILFFNYLFGKKDWRKHKWNELGKIITKGKVGKIYEFDGNEILKDRKEWIIRSKFKVNLKPININVDEIVEVGNYTMVIKEVNSIIMDKAPNREYIDKKKVENKQLAVRKWRNGDIFQPIGMKGTQKISDYLTNHKISTVDKENQLVMTADDVIIWLCGQRLSEEVKIDSDTEEYLELSIKSNVG